jgi:hypothetical protein
MGQQGRFKMRMGLFRGKRILYNQSWGRRGRQASFEGFQERFKIDSDAPLVGDAPMEHRYPPASVGIPSAGREASCGERRRPINRVGHGGERGVSARSCRRSRADTGFVAGDAQG